MIHTQRKCMKLAWEAHQHLLKRLLENDLGRKGREGSERGGFCGVSISLPERGWRDVQGHDVGCDGHFKRQFYTA